MAQGEGPRGEVAELAGEDPQRGDPVRGQHVGPERARRASAPSEVSPGSVSRRRGVSSSGRTGATARVRGVGAGGAAVLLSMRSAWAPAVPPNEIPQGRKRRRPFG